MGGGCGERGDEGAWRGTEREVKQGWDSENIGKNDRDGRKDGEGEGDGRSTLANEEKGKSFNFVHT